MRCYFTTIESVQHVMSSQTENRGVLKRKQLLNLQSALQILTLYMHIMFMTSVEILKMFKP